VNGTGSPRPVDSGATGASIGRGLAVAFPSRFTRFLEQDVWRPDDPWARGRAGRVALAALRLAIVIVRAARDPALNLRAMGLVYIALLSLVPLLAVSFSVLTAFGAHNRIEPFLTHVLEPLGPKGAEITRRVVEFVNNMRVGVLGTVGVAGLFYTVLSMIHRIEAALNEIWHVRRARALARKFTDYLSILLVGPVLVLAAMAIIGSAQSNWLVQRIVASTPFQAVVLVVAGQVAPFLFLWGAFSFLYAFGPNTAVRPVSAVVGGAVAAVLWQVSGVAFTSFVAGSSRYAAISSGFAALAVFLVWLYVAWLILLIGSQVAYFQQYPASYVATRTRQGASVRERIALCALVDVTRRHVTGQPPAHLRDLAATIAAPVTILEDLVDDFVRRGILLRSIEPEGIALARAPELVSAAEALEVIRDPEERDSTAPDSETGPVADVLGARDRAVRDVLQGVTLRSLAERASLREVESSLGRVRR
jgi:membrane protein